jgi:phosphoglycerol transferase
MGASSIEERNADQFENDAYVHSRSLVQYLIAGWRWALGGAILSFELASILTLGWPAGILPTLKLPYFFEADGVAIQWLVQRAIDGWIFDNPRSGWPFGSNFLDYPGSDSGNFVIYKVLGLITHSGAASFDLFFLLSFPVIFVVSFVVSRSFGLRSANAAAAAILFAFAPFHFARFFYGHDLYLYYFSVPLFFHYGKNLVVHGKTHTHLSKASDIAWLIVTIAALSSFGVYFAFFGLIVIMLSALLAIGFMRSARPLVSAFALCLAVGIGVVLNLLPSIIHIAKLGRNSEVAVRYPVETEMYALKLMNLLLPQPDHRISAWGHFAKNYDATFPLSNATASVGIVGTLGLLIVVVCIGSALSGRAPGRRLALCASVVISLLLIGTVGGLNDVFALLISPLIRGWDRISIFIQFGAILAFFIVADRSRFLARGHYRTTIAAAVIAIAGFLDQTPTSYSAQVHGEFAAAEMDRSFVERIEAHVPPGSAIYQLPYIAFPESANVGTLNVYQLGTGYFESKNLRWSFGGMAGREGDLFYRAMAKEPVLKQVEVLKRMGFAGVYMDLRGYEDHGASAIASWTGALGSPPALWRSDKNVVFFTIPGHLDRTPDGLDARSIMARAEYFADRMGARSNATMAEGIDFSASSRVPLLVSSIDGLSVPESWGRWSDGLISRTIQIDFAAPLPSRFNLIVSGLAFGPNIGKALEVTVGSVKHQVVLADNFEISIPFDLGDQKISRIELSPPAPTSPKSLGMNDDPRELGIGLRYLKIR